MNVSGTHLMVDGITMMSFTGEYLEKFLADVSALSGMKVINGPIAYGGPSCWDALVVLSESHGAVHIHGKEVYVDIFSCKSFEINPALELIKQRLKLRNMRVEEISRPILG